MRSNNPRAVSRSRRGARLACGPRRSDGHLLAEVAHEQDGAHVEPRGAEQVLSGKRGAGDRQVGLALGRAKHERGKPLPRSLGRRGDTRRERARTMVLSRFGGANSLSMISFTPMIAETRAVVVRPACLDGPKHATAKERALFRVWCCRNVPGASAKCEKLENAVADDRRAISRVAYCSRLSRLLRQCDRRETCTDHAAPPSPRLSRSAPASAGAPFDRRVRFENSLVGTRDQP